MPCYVHDDAELKLNSDPAFLCKFLRVWFPDATLTQSGDYTILTHTNARRTFELRQIPVFLDDMGVIVV